MGVSADGDQADVHCQSVAGDAQDSRGWESNGYGTEVAIVLAETCSKLLPFPFMLLLS